MTDDGETVRLTEDEYFHLKGRLFHYLVHGGNWEFPWKGPRNVFVITKPTPFDPLNDRSST